jgi:hypothetical protein
LTHRAAVRRIKKNLLADVARGVGLLADLFDPHPPSHLRIWRDRTTAFEMKVDCDLAGTVTTRIRFNPSQPPNNVGHVSSQPIAVAIGVIGSAVVLKCVGWLAILGKAISVYWRIMVPLRDDVELYIKQGHPRELEGLLEACANDGSLEALLCVSRLFEDMYGGITFNFQLKAPAAWELACWGERGINQLVDATVKAPTSKNVSLCLDILSHFAAGDDFTVAPLFCDEGRRARLHEMMRARPELASHARSQLIAFVLSVHDEDELLGIIAGAFQKAGFSQAGTGRAKEVFAALSARWLTISEPPLQRYEALIASHPDDEPAFQAFLTEHPQVLDPMAAEVWPQPRLHGAEIPDFVIRRFDDSYVVIEIETPTKRLVTSTNQMSAAVTYAVAQASEYRRFIERLPTARMHFPELDQVVCLVVIGLEQSLIASQQQALRNFNREHYGLQVVGFDWLARRGRAVRENLIKIGVPVRMHTRVA